MLKRNNKEISFNEINITVAVREPLSLVEKHTLTLFKFSEVSLFSTLISFFFLLLRFIDFKLLMTQLTVNSFNTVGSKTFVLHNSHLYKSHFIIYLR